jgi:hypothetical protein
VANDITQPDAGFDVDTNRVTMIDKKGKAEALPLMSKREVAERILDRVKGMMTDSKTEIIIIIMPYMLSYKRIHIPSHNKTMFPAQGTKFVIELDKNTLINANIDEKTGQIFNMGKLYKAYQLKVGDKVRITVIEPMKKYRLEIVK